jgi:hypothetical protein
MFDGRFTANSHDIQKEFQRSALTVLDRMPLRNRFLVRLKLMENAQVMAPVDMENEASPPVAKRRILSTWIAIRQEIMLTIINRLKHRLHEYQTQRIQQYCNLF